MAAGNHTHDAADVISGEFNRARVRKMTSADTRGTNPDPQTYESALQADFKQNTTDGLSDGGTYHGVISFRPYGSTTDFSGGQMHQMGFTDNGNLWMRKSTGISSWGSWQKLLTSTDIGTISGTQNYISKFTSSNALGNSLLFDNGTSIGIGTATPGATNKLDISYTTGSSGGKGINVSITGNASWSSPDIGLSSSVANSNASLGYGVYGQSTSSSASSGRNWGIYGYAHNGGTNVGTAGYVTSTSGNNAGILGVLNGYESFDVATTMAGSWAGFFSGPVKTTGQITSSLATGTSPFNVTSTTVNTNLNADLLDGNHASAFQTALTNPVTGTGSSGHVSYWNGATTQTYDSDGNFFWDATNNRLGIGTAGPSQKLHISGGNILNEGILYQNTSLGQGSGAHGISWYNPSFYTWFDYMAPAGSTNSPSGTAAPSDASANVTTWARRFNIENVNGYGWLFESGTNASGSAPTVKFAISSNTGTFHSTGNANIDGTVNAGSYAVLGTGINGGYYQDATNGAYRSIVASSTTNGYYFQTNTGATTTMYVGLGGTYNGNVGIGTTTPSTKLEVSGQIKITGGSPGSGKVLTSDASGLATWQPIGGTATSGTVASGNWYRIASNTGNRANAEFTLRDYISGGGHSTLTFRVGTSYNDASGTSFTLINHNRYGSVTFTKVRVLQATTYDAQYLEVYCVRDGSVDFSIYDNLQSSGWVPIAWTAGSIPGGYTAREFDVDNLFVVGDYDDRFTINRGGNVGIGTTTPGVKLDISGGSIRTNNQLISTVATGTSPLAVSSTTLVSNLNADLLDGNHASAFAAASHTHLWSQVTSKPADWLDAANLIQDNGNFNNSVPSGFYQGYGSTNAPTGSTWYNMINVRHSNTGNDHGFQIAASYYDENIWTRTYQGGSGANNGTFTPWRALIHTGNIVSQVTAAGFIPNNGNGDWQIASNSTGTSYNLATLELRESNFTATGAATPPRLGFHWGGVVASQIGIESSGRIVILNNPGTAYENLAAKDLYLSGQITVAGGSPAVGKVLTSDASGLGTWNYPTATVSSSLHPSMDDISGWTTLNSTEIDDAAYTVSWGFNFTIEGVNYTQGWISTNGILGFGSSSSTTYSNSSLPISSSSDPMLFFHWDDHYGRNIRYVVLGTSPSRICFIEWEGFPRSGTFGNAANYVHAYITLHEGSNVVSVRYLNQGSNVDAQGASATFGFQYAGGGSAKTIPMGYNTRLLDDNASNQQFSIDF